MNISFKSHIGIAGDEHIMLIAEDEKGNKEHTLYSRSWFGEFNRKKAEKELRSRLERITTNKKGAVHSMIGDKLLNELANNVSEKFTGYRTVRVSGHLESVPVIQKTLKSYKSKFGFKYDKSYEVSTKYLIFTNIFYYTHSILYHKIDRYIVSCAIDEVNKTVYWKVQLEFA